MQYLWVGIDAGKTHHHAVVIDTDATRLLSRRVLNDEAVLKTLIDDVLDIADGGEVVWAVDLNSGGAALLTAMLAASQQTLMYIPGRIVHHAAGGYRGDAKTDAKDAAIIADQARMRRDLQPMRVDDEIAVELGILTSRRTDLMRDRTRSLNRLRALLSTYFPALERALDLSNVKGALILLTGYQTPGAIRTTGAAKLEVWLRKRKAYNANGLAALATEAALAQTIQVPGEAMAAQVVSSMATDVLDLGRRVADLDRTIEAVFKRHATSEIVESMPGIGPLLGAELVAATGGDVSVFGTADRFAAVAGLAPAPRDSGRISGNLRRPRRYDRRLLRVAYLSAQLSVRSCSESRAYYERKRAEGKRHTQAVLALARRRSNVLWAMLRDGTPYRPGSSASAGGCGTPAAA